MEAAGHPEPQTWHYGLVARWWAEFAVAQPEELDFYRGCIERFGQPALDLACGTGRLLVPLLESGLDVDGCDISADMLAHCRQKAEGAGFAPRLYQQAMHQIDLPQRYGAIYICGSFGLGGSRANDLETLRRCLRLLAPGGAVVFNVYLPYSHAGRWQYWLPEKRDALPEDWPEMEEPRTTSDGAALQIRTRVVALDPLEQHETLEIQARLWNHGEVVAHEERKLRTRLYFRDDVLHLLEGAGFTDVDVYGDYSWGPPTPISTMLVFVARA